MYCMTARKVHVLYNDSLIGDKGVVPNRRASQTSTADMNAAVEGDDLWAARWPFVTRMFDDAPFQRGDYLLDVGTFNIEGENNIGVCNNVYRKLNIDHPQGWEHRSMSIGDVVIIDGGEAYAVAETGFAQVELTDVLASPTI